MAVEPVDFRKGIGALKALCRQKLRDDRFSGTVFVFTNCMRTAVKLLVYDASGGACGKTQVIDLPKL